MSDGGWIVCSVAKEQVTHTDKTLLIDQAPFAIGLVAPDGTMLHVSPPWVRLLGFDPTGMTYQSFTHPDDLAPDVEQHRMLVAGEISSYNMIKRYRHADGRWIYVLLEVRILPSGQAIAYVSDISKDIEIRQQLELKAQLSAAILRHELVLHYQPIVRLEGGATVGYEALLRWQQPDRLVYPDAFLPATDTDTMELITFEVLRIAIDDIPKLEPYWVAVNLDPRTLRSQSFAAKLLAFLRVSCLDPSGLRLEVTEQYLIDLDTVGKALASIAEIGHAIELDDVGSDGYSNLSLITQRYFKAIKIDKALTDRIFDDDENHRIQKLFRRLLNLSEDLSLEVVVEGIETERQRAWLSANGFVLGQGWLFGKAAPLNA